MPDEELVREALKDPESYGAIIERYEEPLRRYIRRIASPSPDEIDDILQNTFIKVYQNLNDYDPSLKFSSWIYRITHNETIDHVRARKRHASLDTDEDSAYEKIADTIDTADLARERIAKEQIAALLDKLKDDYRAVLILRFMEDKDYQEISDILKKPIGTVGTLINRAKKALREEAEKLHMHTS